MKKVFFTGFLALMLVVPVLHVSAQTPPANATGGAAGGSSISLNSCTTLADHGLGGLVTCVVAMFNLAIYLMISGAVVFIMWGAFNMIASEEKREAGKHTIYYGIIGLFVMVSIWGLVNILATTFGLSGKSSTDVIKNSVLIKLP